MRNQYFAMFFLNMVIVLLTIHQGFSQSPSAVCKNIVVYLNSEGNYLLEAEEVNNGSLFPGGSLTVIPNQFDCNNLGMNAVTLTATNGSGESSSCVATVQILDTIAPIAQCKNITLTLDAEGNAQLQASDLNDGSSDACGISSMSLSETNFSCSQVGINAIVLTVTDESGNASSCTAIVDVVDNVQPIAQCVPTFTLSLDADGVGTLLPENIDQNSSDACGISMREVSKSAFSCADVGNTTNVMLLITDSNGNQNSCNSNVIVELGSAPTAICKDTTLALNTQGNAFISPMELDNGSFDVCGGDLDYSLNKSNFGCEDVGSNVVVLTLTNQSGRESFCNSTVFIREISLSFANDTKTRFGLCMPNYTFELVSTDSIYPTTISFSGNGILNPSSGVFDPSLAGVGTHTITASALVNGCLTFATIEVMVTPLQLDLLPYCTCSNDSEVNQANGTFKSTLRIKGEEALPTSRIFRVFLAGGLYLEDGNLLPANTPFVYCNGIGCPFGVEQGEYYLEIFTEDGSTQNFIEVTETCSNSLLSNTSIACSGYPSLPTMPAVFEDSLVCLESNLLVPRNGGYYSLNSDPKADPILPPGFEQLGGNLSISMDSITNLTITLFLHKRSINSLDGFVDTCYSTSARELTFLKRPSLISEHFACIDTLSSPVVFLNNMLESFSDQVGKYFINGNLIENGDFRPSTPGCYPLTYDPDICGFSPVSTQFLVTFTPQPKFNISSNLPSPVCSAGDTVQISLNRLSTGFFPNIIVSSGDGGPTARVVGNINTGSVVLRLPAPAQRGGFRYTICLEESGFIPTGDCGEIKASELEPCTRQFCQSFTVFNDGFGCGADAIFPNQCVLSPPTDLCPTSTKPTLDFSCRWFTIRGPRIITSSVRGRNAAYNCKDEEIEAVYSLNLPGILGTAVASGPKVGSLPGMNVICSILNWRLNLSFKVFGKRFTIIDIKPFGSLGDGCNRTIGQIILDALSRLIGGDGGGGFVAGDTRGFGNFDVIEEIPFGISNRVFTIPNRIQGTGHIGFRVAGGWPFKASSICGNIVSQQILLLDLLPIGAIPIVGGPVEDLLAAAGCNIDMTFSTVSDVLVPVFDNSPPQFYNCVEDGYTFYTTTGCEVPVDWAIPSAFEDCRVEALFYKGYVAGGVGISEPGIYQVMGEQPGSILPPGSYPVTYWAVGCSGNFSTCSFTVNVSIEKPILSVPANLTFHNDVNSCTRTINGLAPTQGLGCLTTLNYRYTQPISNTVVETNSTSPGIHNIPNGHTFEKGTTLIQYTLTSDNNGNGIIEADEIQTRSFSVTVVDGERPLAQCIDVEVTLNNQGLATVFAQQNGNNVFIDGGCVDNCDPNPLILISRDGSQFSPSVQFTCDDIGDNFVTLRVVDAEGNSSDCTARVKVHSFLEPFQLNLAIPTICLGPFQESFDLKNYVTIDLPNGNSISHHQLGSLGSLVFGQFMILGFTPDFGEDYDEGLIDEEGLFTPGHSKGYLRIGYAIGIEGESKETSFGVEGCYKLTSQVIRVENFEPKWEAGFLCCDAPPVWLGGAGEVIPSGFISLESIGGTYPTEKKGSWSGQGVVFSDPDGLPFSGDEFFYFDPSGLEGNYSLTYRLSGEACQQSYVSSMRVTCQPLQFEVSSFTVCPNSPVAEIEIRTSLSDYNLKVSTEGMNAVGGVDLVDHPVVNGRAVIPSFLSTVAADEIFPIKVTVGQNNDFGCRDEFDFTIRVQDLEPPTFINCSQGEIFTISLFPSICEGGTVWSIPVPNDNCSLSSYEQTLGPSQDSLLAVGFYEIEYTAIDFAGNVSHCTFYIEVVDTQDPVVVCPGNVVIYATDFGQCEWESPQGSLSPLLAASNCPATITWEVMNPSGFVENGFNDVSGYTFSLGESIVTYTITENASLQNWSCSFTVSIFDNESPVLFCPDDLVLECAHPDNDQLISLWLQSFQATDNCDLEVMLVSSIFSTDSQCGNTETLLYKVVASDFSGNTTECFRRVIILDTTPPMVTIPAQDFTVQCDGSNNALDILNWLNNHGFAQATDACGTLQWSNNYGELEVDCGLTGGVEVTFFVRDDCGNVSSTVATFSIVDTLPPVWEKLPLDLWVECDGTSDPYEQVDFWLQNVGGGNAEDDCSLVKYTHDFVGLNQDCGVFTGTALVVFTATDACGNSVSSSATVRVVDRTPPVILTQARDTVVECNGLGNIEDLESWLENNGGSTAWDPCSEPLTWHHDKISSIFNCGGTFTHRYRFYTVDACGNVSVNTEADFIVLDRSSPTLVEEAKDRVVECDGSGNLDQLFEWIENNGGAIAEDLCSEFIWTYNLVNTLEECNGTRSQRFDFRATDFCGNFVTTTASFVIIDSSPPIITGGADQLMEECLVPPVGNFPEFLYWLDTHAGATAMDVCGHYTWTHDYHPSHWVYQCGNTRYIDVVFTATDLCGNASSISHRFSIGDLTPPEFTNCPRLPIIVDAPLGWCSAFVNFSAPAAIDNCSKVTIHQIDTTGLNSGSLFPVGLTILIFEAVDECNNRDTCQYKIIVNDYKLPPDFSCPVDKVVANQEGLCSAPVPGLSLRGLEDNCLDNVSVIYRVENEFSEILDCGILDASNTVFKQGYNQLIYEVRDQPIVLITQVVQNEFESALEITNFGPAAFDITCLEIKRLGINPEDYLAPSGSLLLPGESFVQIFTPVEDLTAPVSYTIGFLDHFIDGLSLHGFHSAFFEWNGILQGNRYSRIRICDTDSAEDWRFNDDCFVSPLGVLNGYLSPFVFPWNGSFTTLQSRAPSYRECSVNIIVEDVEPPLCRDRVVHSLEGDPISIEPGKCNQSLVQVNDDFPLSRVRVKGLKGNFDPMFELAAKLVSPSGTEVLLFENICGNSANFNIGFDDDSPESLQNVVCSPAGNGRSYQPLHPLKGLAGERSLGTWRLELYSSSDQVGLLEGWQLEIEELLPYSQGDVVLQSEPGKCGAQYEWIHPYYSDNCCEGVIRVSYFSPDNIRVPSPSILSERGGFNVSEFFEVGETLVTYELVDQFGNESSCSFSVSVLDLELPTLSPLGCVDHQIYLQPTECSTKFEYPPLSEMDNCGIASVVYDPPVGYDFPIGDHLVSVTVTDFSGNVVNCEFTVSVIEFIPSSIQMFCNSEINLSLGPDCLAEINADLLLEGSNYRCYENYCITLRDVFGNVLGSSEEGTAYVGVDQIGTTVMAEVCSCREQVVLCCTVMIYVKAFSIPRVVCPSDVVLACNGNSSPEFTGFPVLENCVPSLKIDYYDVFVNHGTCGSPRATLERHWIISNDFGDKVNCLQMISFENFSNEMIAFPPDYVLDLSLDCEEVMVNEALTHPTNTGYPTLMGGPLLGSHLCEFNVGYWDEILQDANCQGSYEILRHWTVRNECLPLSLGQNPLRHLQAIKVNDKKGPVLKVNFDDVVLSTHAFSCTADYSLGVLSQRFEDDCSALDKFTVLAGGCQVVKGKDGEFLLKNLKKGVNAVRIFAYDNCWNATEVNFNITVVDAIPPVAVCIGELTVSLGSDGRALLQASHLDNGSYDNCGGIKLEIKRLASLCSDDDLVYGESIQFCCEDLGSGPVPVHLRVWDDADGDGIFGSSGDYFTECLVSVQVDSKLVPIIQCPETLVVGCETDLDSLALSHQPLILEGCSNLEFIYEDEFFTDHCNLGKVERKWSVLGFPQTACIQTIYLEAPKPFDPSSDIVWPQDWEGDCLDLLPYPEPIIHAGVCKSVMVSKKDQVFQQMDDACYLILREWVVIDACIYDPNDDQGLGKYTWEQVIRIVDNTAPEVTLCDEITVSLSGGDCQVGSIFIPQSALDYSCGIGDDLIWTYHFYLEGYASSHQTGQVFGKEVLVEIQEVPLGNHRIIWEIKDRCGNQSACVQIVEVVDKLAPSPLCKGGVVVVPMNGGLLTLEAAWFNAGSYDNCTPSTDLQYSFSGESVVTHMDFDCSDLINGVSHSVELPIWVWDAQGNSDFCTVSLVIQDQDGSCPDVEDMIQRVHIAGGIKTLYNHSLSQVEVTLSSYLPEFPKSTQSDYFGQFAFPSIQSPAYFLLSAEKDDDPLNGVSTLDLVLLQRYLLGTFPILGPYKLIAADVNNDHKISGLDIRDLRNLILQKTSRLPNNTSWRFIDKNYVFSNPQSPWPFDEKIAVHVQEDPISAVFDHQWIGIKIGDINGNAGAAFTEERSLESFTLLTENTNLEMGRIYTIPLNLNRSDLWSGFQFTLHFNGLEVLELTSELPGFDLQNYHLLPNHVLTLSYHAYDALSINSDEPLLYIKVKSHTQGKLSEGLKLSSLYTQAEAYKGQDLKVAKVELMFKEIETLTYGYRLHQNEPNPFTFDTKIQFEVPQDQICTFTIFGLQGQEVYKTEIKANKGLNEVFLDKALLKGAGIYYYSLESGAFQATKKMIVID
jgi:hypothetical protein